MPVKIRGDDTMAFISASRFFRKRTGNELGFDCHANTKAWMATALFFNWLEHFNSFVGKKEGRRVDP